MHIITVVIFVALTDTRTIIACQSGRMRNTHTACLCNIKNIDEIRLADKERLQKISPSH